MVRVSLTGPVEVSVDGHPVTDLGSKKARWILAILILRLGRRVPRAWLAGELWPDQEPSQAKANLRQNLAMLRQCLGSAASLIASPDPLHLTIEQSNVSVDLFELDDALDRDPRRAVELYNAPLLQGCEEPWAVEARRTREEAILSALEALAVESPPSIAAGYWRRALALDPYRESAVRGLMQALFATGDAAASLKVYREFQLLLHRDLNASPSPATTALSEEHRRPAKQTPARITPDRKSADRLPTALTQLIGREGDLDRIGTLLLQTRLLTLLGPGGNGKTRLAIEAARNARESYSGGAWFVDLSPIRDGNLVAQRIGEALGITEPWSTAWESVLVGALAPQNMLVVLDNCEHVVEASAGLAYRLLQQCPRLSILATSREALDVPGEHRLPVASLALAPSGLNDLVGYEAYSSVRLFAARAKERHPEFALNSENAEMVAEICRRLDGMPLAIEMAAARVSQMPVAVLLRRLEDRFALLRNWSRTVTPRQRTLEGVIDWSYQLLSCEEQKFLNRLSVFAGDWSAEAAAAVAAFAPLDADQTEPMIQSLVAKNLLKAEWRDDARYRLLETVSQYAAERLAASGEADAVRRRHFDFYCALVHEGKGWRMGTAEQIWAKRCETEYPNLRRAAEWSFDTDADAALRIVAGLSRYWTRWRRHVAEGVAMVRRALKLPVSEQAVPDRLEIVFRCHAMTTWDGMGDPVYPEDAIELARERGENGWLACLLGGKATCVPDRPELARTLLHEALRIGVPGHPADRPQMWHRCLLGLEPDPATAEFHFNRALALSRESGDLEMEGLLQLHRGYQDPEAPDPAKLKYAEAAEVIFRQLGLEGPIGWVHAYRDVVALAEEDYASLIPAYLRGAESDREAGNIRGAFFARLNLADALSSVGETRRAWKEMKAARELIATNRIHPNNVPEEYCRLAEAILDCRWEGASRLYGDLRRHSEETGNGCYDIAIFRSRARFHGIRHLGLARFEELAAEGAKLFEKVAV